MLIICDEEDKEIIMNTCGGECDGCVFKDVKCPVDCRMIITDTEIARGKDMQLRYY